MDGLVFEGTLDERNVVRASCRSDSEAGRKARKLLNLGELSRSRLLYSGMCKLDMRLQWLSYGTDAIAVVYASVDESRRE